MDFSSGTEWASNGGDRWHFLQGSPCGGDGGVHQRERGLPGGGLWLCLGLSCRIVSRQTWCPEPPRIASLSTRSMGFLPAQAILGTKGPPRPWEVRSTWIPWWGFSQNFPNMGSAKLISFQRTETFPGYRQTHSLSIFILKEQKFH